MDKSDLRTFMKDSVASRCEDPAFRDFVTNFLGKELDMNKSDIVTFMKGSVASRCKDPAFCDFITEFLIGKLGMDKRRRRTLLYVRVSTT